MPAPNPTPNEPPPNDGGRVDFLEEVVEWLKDLEPSTGADVWEPLKAQSGEFANWFSQQEAIAEMAYKLNDKALNIRKAQHQQLIELKTDQQAKAHDVDCRRIASRERLTWGAMAFAAIIILGLAISFALAGKPDLTLHVIGAVFSGLGLLLGGAYLNEKFGRQRPE